MSNLVRILMLLASVPLLQPPGFCICKTAAVADASRSDPEVVLTGTVTPKKACCRECIRSCDPSTLVDEVHPKKQAPLPCPNRDDDSHMPGCPASAGVDRFKWIEPYAPVVEVLLMVEWPIPISTPEHFPTSTRPFLTPQLRLDGPPLFIFHCSLVI